MRCKLKREREGKLKTHSHGFCKYDLLFCKKFFFARDAMLVEKGEGGQIKDP